MSAEKTPLYGSFSKDYEPLEKERESPSTYTSVEEHVIPDVSFLSLFVLFLKFGCLAWGGPIAQIAMMKEHFVTQENWITVEQFNRVLAVYQALPGPEATELACYFGMIARGRLGSILAGLGFVLPGLILMTFLSWFYVEYGLGSIYLQAIFLGIQPAVAAMVFRAVHKIGNGTFIEHDTGQFNIWLLCIALSAGIQNVMGINFFITLAWCGLESLFIIDFPKTSTIKKLIGYSSGLILLIFGLSGYIIYVIFIGKPDTSIIGSDVISGNEWYTLLVLGLLTGVLTFGGAYTAIPFVQHSAVIAGGWLTNQQFLDGIALASVLPAPLVIFITFVGYIGGGFLGAFLMTFGVFFPAFSFTLIGHEFFEKITQLTSIMAFLDGVTAGAVGLIGVSAIIIAKTTINNIVSLFIFVLCLGASYVFDNKITNMAIIVISATASQILLIDTEGPIPPPSNVTLLN